MDFLQCGGRQEFALSTPMVVSVINQMIALPM
jgi:hypothetical protein